MTKRGPLLLLLALAALCWPNPALSAGDQYDPHPTSGDLSLPMPDGARMVFRPVYLGRTLEGLGTRPIYIGKPQGGYFYETPTQVEISGSFNEASGGAERWLYFLGKYEVTEAQYYSVMPPPSGASRQEMMKSNKPITDISWFQAQEFLRRYNEWLFKNAADKLPRSKGMQGASNAYLRLPLEEEWEFAARGGGLIEATQYFSNSPYPPGQLGKYEWFFPEVVRNPPRIRPVGRKNPHPLGFYDLLGNAVEMTMSLYRVEYNAGRTGGFIVRGGSALKNVQKNMLPSLRSEMPFYKDGQASARDDMGLRVMIGATATANTNEFDQLRRVYETYSRNKPVFGISLGGPSEGLEKLNQSLQELSPKAYKALGPQLNEIKANIDLATRKMQKVESDSALVSVRTAVYCLFAVYETLVHDQPLRQIYRNSKSEGRRQRAEHSLKQNQEARQESLAQYAAQLALMDQLYTSEVMDKQLEEHRKMLANESAAWQKIKLNELLRRHYHNFLKSKQPDPEGWSRDLETTFLASGSGSTLERELGAMVLRN